MSRDCGYSLFLKRNLDITSVNNLYKRMLYASPYIRFSAPLEDTINYTYNPRQYLEHGNPFCEVIIDEILKFRIKNSYEPTAGYPDHTVLNGIRQVDVIFGSEKYDDPIHVFWEESEKYAIEMEKIFAYIFKELDAFLMFGWHENVFYLRNTQRGSLSDLDYFQAVISEPFPEWTTFIFDNELVHSIGRSHLDKWAKIVHPIDDVGFFISHTNKPFIFTGTTEDVEKEYNALFLDYIAPKIIQRIRTEFKSIGLQ